MSSRGSRRIPWLGIEPCLELVGVDPDRADACSDTDSRNLACCDQPVEVGAADVAALRRLVDGEET